MRLLQITIFALCTHFAHGESTLDQAIDWIKDNDTKVKVTKFQRGENETKAQKVAPRERLETVAFSREHSESLKSLLKADSLRGGPHRCPFRPDYEVSFENGDKSVVILFCFGCLDYSISGFLGEHGPNSFKPIREAVEAALKVGYEPKD